MADAKVSILIQAKDAEKTRQALKKIGVDSKQMGAQMGMASKSVALLKGAMVALVGTVGILGVIMGVKGIVRSAIEFESAFAGVRKTVDATEREFEQLRKRLIDMSTVLPVAAKELAGIQEIAGQLGIRGVDNLTMFTEAVAKIAVTTNLTQESAAIGFARIAAVIGEPIENINRMASAVVDLGNKFEVNEAEIITFSQRIAGMGKVAKLNVEDLFGIGAAFASVGIQAEAGGTAVNKVLLELQKQGKTGKEAFVEFVNSLEEAGDDAAIMLEELGFKQARTQRAFLSLAGAGGKLEKALNIANVAFEEGNALNEEAEKRFATTASKVELLKNNMSALNIQMGEIFLPILSKVVVSLTNVAKGVRIAFAEEHFEDRFDEIITKTEELNESLGNIKPPGVADTEAVEKEAEKIASIEEMWTAADEKQRARIVALTQHEMEQNKFKIDTFAKANTSMWTLAAGQRDAFSAGMSKVFKDWIKGTGSVEDSFKALGEKMLDVLIDWVVQTAVNAAISKAMNAAAVAVAAVTGKAVAAAWAPAAALASLATLGANAAPANAALVGTVLNAKSLALLAGQEGGTETVQKPTVFLAGERGSERVTVEPMRRGGGGEGGGKTIIIDIRIDTAVLNSPENMSEFVTMLREEIGIIDERELIRTESL